MALRCNNCFGADLTPESVQIGRLSSSQGAQLLGCSSSQGSLALAPPCARRHTYALFECAIECCLGFVADLSRHLRQPHALALKQVRCQLHAPACQVLHGRIQPPSRDTQIAAAILDRKVVHVPDSEAPGIPEPSPIIARAFGYRSLRAVPMLKDGNSVGAIAVVRLGGAGPFSEAQIELVKTFADQAVIAIENARLFQAEQVSKRELIEALEQQTATADVLKAISRSALDVQKVFDALVESAARLCDANDA